MKKFGAAPAFGLYMTTYQYFKEKLKKYRFYEDKDGLRIFTSGIIAEFFGCILWLPADIIKERLQA